MIYLTPDNQIDQKKEKNVAKAKPEPIENWENEGGQVIPTGSLPKVTFPQDEQDEKEGKERHS